MQGQSNNYQHPHSNQQQPNNFTNSPLNQQQSLMNNPQGGPHSMMNNNNLPGSHMGNVMPPHQSHMGQMNPTGGMPPHQQQHDLYFRQGQQQDSSATSPGMIMGQHMQMSQQQLKMSDLEFQEAFEKNRIVSSSAITRAVQDASIGNNNN